ncbi:MAG: M67 family metallopeptidase [Armatimonadetes bacterium]|nr:M67 family metallopeptidase [Armatimonadota bacterium]
MEALVSDLRSAYPREGCGFLGGAGGKATHLFPVANSEQASPEERYLMDSREQLRALKSIDALGLELVAIYHSHPRSEAYPSALDIERALWQENGEARELYPSALYVIVSFRDRNAPAARSFRIKAGGRVQEIPIVAQ